MERTKPPKTNGQVLVNRSTLQTLGTVLSRAALFSRLGYQYGGDRKIYEALGYPTSISYDDYMSRYLRQDIAKAVIDRPVSYTWKGPIILKLIGEEESKIGEAWKELDKRLKLRSKFVRLDRLSCIGRYGVLLLGFDDVRSKEDFRRPVSKGEKKQLIYVKPLGEGNAEISKFVTDTKNPRYGFPEEYSIEYNESSDDTTVTLKAHWSRVLHVTNELTESEVYGVPVLEGIWNRLLDLEKLVGGSAEMFWRGARPGYQGKVKDDYTLPKDVEDGLQDQIDEFEHNLRRILINEGVDLEALSSQVSDPANHVDIQIQMISAKTGIPKRILTGSERGELSSAQDVVSWFSYIQTRREEHAEVNILRPFVDLCMDYGILPKTDKHVVEWSDLFASSEKDKAEIGRVRAMAVREYTQNPMAESLIPPKAFYKLFLGLSEDEQNEIIEMSSEEVAEEMRQIAEQTPPEPTEDETGKVANKPINKNSDGS